MAIRAGITGLLIRRQREFTPEDRPIVIDKDLGPEVTFTFIDIIPGEVYPQEFHGFSNLIDEANKWLGDNCEWEVINCETVLLFFKWNENGMHLAPEDTCFPLDGDAHQSLMGLRLWITRRLVDQTNNSLTPDQPQVINYVDFTPNIDTDSGQRFRKLDQVLDRINFEFQAGVHPKIGTIITIETLYHPVTSDWKINPKNTLNNFPSRCVSVIRIFYSKKPPGVKFNSPIYKLPVIGIEDFVPKQISSGGFFKSPVFENFSQVLTRATEWITSNPELEFKNAQCLEVKMKIMGRVDTKIMSHNADRGDYIRIYRVAYTKSTNYVSRIAVSRPQLDMRDVLVKVTPSDDDEDEKNQQQEQEKNKHLDKEQEVKDTLQVVLPPNDQSSTAEAEANEAAKEEDAPTDEPPPATGVKDEPSPASPASPASPTSPDDHASEDSGSKSIKIKFERINTDGTGETIEPELHVNVPEEPPKYECVSSTPLTSNPPPAPIFLSSIIFTPADQDATVYEIKRKMHEWIDQASKFSYRDGPIISRPRLLSAETVEIFCKDFSEYEIKLETENTFKPNRIGTMNQFLFMAFRVYFDVGYFGNRMESRRVSSTIVAPGSGHHKSSSSSSSCSASCVIS